MKNRLIISFFVFPIFLFSQNFKPFDNITMGYTFGIGNSFYDNTGINAFLIDKGYFPMSGNNF